MLNILFNIYIIFIIFLNIYNYLYNFKFYIYFRVLINLTKIIDIGGHKRLHIKPIFRLSTFIGIFLKKIIKSLKNNKF